MTRAKDNMKYKVEEDICVDKSTGAISDENIKLTATMVSKDYSDLLRLGTYEDFEDGKVYQLITNDFTHDALTVAELYRARWKVELFFKWIKQHLHIKSFFGTTENAIYTHIWIAVYVYLILLIARKVCHIEQDLNIFSQAMGLVLFETIHISDILKRVDESKLEPSDTSELWLFDE